VAALLEALSGRYRRSRAARSRGAILRVSRPGDGESHLVSGARETLLRFIENVLASERFEPDRVDGYLL
jgi:hypothetical protein